MLSFCIGLVQGKFSLSKRKILYETLSDVLNASVECPNVCERIKIYSHLSAITTTHLKLNHLSRLGELLQYIKEELPEIFISFLVIMLVRNIIS